MKEIYKEIALKTGGSHYPEVGGQLLEQFADELVRSCAKLIESHADSLSAYKFNDKASTAKTCAGIILEHFGLKDTQ